MKDHVIAERYAGGLSASIESDDRLDAVLETLQDLAETYTEHHDLRTVLKSPAVAPEVREKILDDVLARVEVTGEAADFVRILFKRGRIAMLPDVIAMFRSAVDERLNRVLAHVTTAVALSPEQEDRIREGLSTYSGKTVRIAGDVDPEIIGGIVVRLHYTVIDGSVRARLQRAKQTLLAEER